jgi:hypothetical protein
VWSNTARCDVDGVTETIAHLPLRFGGPAFTRDAWTPKHAHESSKLTADGQRTRQKALAERFGAENHRHQRHRGTHGPARTSLPKCAPSSRTAAVLTSRCAQ